MPAGRLEEDEASPDDSAGRACRRLAYGAARDALILSLLLSSLILSGCARRLPAPPQPVVTLTTTRTTTYFSVRATTTNKIFEEIKAHGLHEQDGEHAVGLATAKSEMIWRARETGALCTPESVTVTLNLVVTLPRHERPDELSNDLRERWEHFAAAVAAHEERHVEIFVNGANTLKARIEAAVKKWASCAELETTVKNLWNSEQADTENAQREFDAADRARVDKDRKPLQAAVSAGRAKLTALTAEIRQLDSALDDVVRRAGAVRDSIDAVDADIAKANGTCSRPTDRIVALCRQSNTLVTRHDALVAEHSSLVAHRERLAGEQNALVASINELIETLNWVR
jgi:predicted secreted Zn-dependent protease